MTLTFLSFNDYDYYRSSIPVLLQRVMFGNLCHKHRQPLIDL